MPMLRFHVRMLMFAVAAAALACYGWVLWWRAAEYRERAAEWGYLLKQHSPITQSAVGIVKIDEDMITFFKTTPDPEGVEGLRYFGDRLKPDRVELQRYAALDAYFTQLRDKYDRAARYPFLPIAPDPPEPK